ncbi:Imm26 family immunity protein [Pseudomonas syringae group sp. J309-1]|uniref:Imm26 family immunity protein n=1 Tax=Pseudomonas syringae group sp. J309-1 TaxID=3079588 RepID=UPI00290A2858|nr:Imm26 family immunity protein [Pseudomonas syringae group sp. J309-1]MDU8359360.1 Imm26 family immunity protein [Pseudomonas syringae group sp. J309-1]
MVKYNSGDIFLIPVTSGGFAVCQIICAFRDRFKRVFSFGVLSVTNDDNNVDIMDKEFLYFKNFRRAENIIFTSVEYLKKGKWKIVGNIPLNAEKTKLKYFRNAGALYFDDEFLEMLEFPRYKDFNVLAVAGYELVNSHLEQFFDQSKSEA